MTSVQDSFGSGKRKKIEMPSWDQIAVAVIGALLTGRMTWPTIRDKFFSGSAGASEDVVPTDRAAYAAYIAAVRTASPEAPPEWQQVYCEAVLSPSQVEILERIRSGKKPAKKTEPVT